MVSIPLLIKDDIEYLNSPVQIDSFGISFVNQAFAAVAQEVMELLKQSYPFQPDSINHAETIMIRAIAPEYGQAIAIEPLTGRELEVLQLIVEGHKNFTIARKLYITTGTVKTHVRNILKKLCASDRTQAAIRALRSGLVH
ncbi:MAG: response regulator transcription factor [Verrucomicrobia bacterium]|nr:response regulator transcription factor [Leptolyngbya sp. ES-bin-22]